jgi:predicted O-methyltransferase YrrM
MARMPDAEAAVEELLASRPRIHWTEDDWGLDRDSMRWLADNVRPDWRTIETGCGQSSILLTLLAGNHTIVAPAPHEHEAVREWCREREISTDHLRSIVDFSQDALPKLTSENFDLALVDGAHAFPIPFIDWYFMASALKVGGYLVVDDVQLRTGRVLSEFLHQEGARWEPVADMGTTVMLRKLADPVVPENDWVGQPWSVEPEPAPSALNAIRSRVRLRTRLRDLARRD